MKFNNSKNYLTLLSIALLFQSFIACNKNEIGNFDTKEPKEYSTAIQNSQNLFFDKGSEWKYLDDGTDQGDAWRSIAFGDTTWKTGSGHFGFGDGDESTLLKSGFITYYFRKKVVLANVNQLPEKLYFYILHDDAAVLYINGKEAIRSALLPKDAPIKYNTGTSSFVPNSEENSFFVYEVSRDYFINGANQLAIEVHNQNEKSSDVSFDCYVRNVKELSVDGPYVFNEGSNYIVKTFDRNLGYIEKQYKTRQEVLVNVQLPQGKDFIVKLNPEPLLPEPSYYEKLPSKYLAVSDLEGNIEGFIRLLQGAKVIDRNLNWTFGDGHLFLVGDMFDRGNHVTQLLWLIYKLEQESKNYKGKVHFILGNHDVMNLINDLRYVNDKYLVNAEIMKLDLAKLYDQNTELGKWIRTKNIIEKVGSDLFVHAGISPQVANLKLDLDQLNKHGRDKLNGTCSSDACKLVTGGTASGLFWYRAMANEELSQMQVDDILAKFGVTKVIIGHTIRKNNNNLIEAIYKQKVLTIDLDHQGNSEKGFMRALYYENGCYTNFQTSANVTTKKALIGPCTN